MNVYRTPNALNDLAYAAFYQCSIYALIVAPLFALLAPRLQFLRLGLALKLPPLAATIGCWLLFDFLNYWIHRLQHVGPLWAFHSVHHAQTQLTFLSSNRIHVVEQLYVSVLMIVPAFVLGVPQPRWLPLLMLQLFSETMQHARLNWTLGPLHRLFVSPASHALHHSTDPREHSGNYARVLSLWDVIFGTFVRSGAPVQRFGVEGMEVPERLTAQFAHPFRLLFRR
jgi:sterol desaturase/sphingolipid hydroxylase (fatty acid hydroxylase superfamily)